jgi:hypothetical protein
VGYLHLLPDSPAFQVENTVVVPYQSPGYPELMLNAMFGLGWDFSKTHTAPFSIGLKAGVFYEYPVHNEFMYHLLAQIVLTIPLDTQD